MKRLLFFVLALGLAGGLAGNDNLNIQVEFRHRFEYQDNFDFNSLADDQLGFHLFRSRLTLSWKATKTLSLFTQFQDARVWNLEVGSPAPYRDQLDIRQAYAVYHPAVFSSFSLTAGRMELIYGEERLIGGFNWSNVAQSFDGIKIRHQKSMWTTDLFAVRKVITEYDQLNQWNDEDTLWGLYTSGRVTSHHILDLYYLFRDTDTAITFGPKVGSGTLSESTIGFFFRGREVAGFDYGFESAYQFGNFGDQDISAYALIIQIGYTLPFRYTPRIGLEYAFGSGDDDPVDGTRNTFDNLFPTNHKFYGYMDRASLQNLKDLRLSFSLVPASKVKVQADIHFLRLAETTDSLYSAARKPLRTSDDPSISNKVGTEFDLTAALPFGDHLSFLFGYSHFSAGDYLADTGLADNGEYFYMQTSLKF